MKRILSFTLSLALMLGASCFSAMAVQADETAVSAEDIASTDAQGTVSWENLKSRIKTGDLSTLALAESIESLNAINYEIMLDDLLNQLNDLASLKWYIAMSGGTGTYENATYDSLKETYDAVRNGDLQQDHVDTKRQLEDAANQILMTGEYLYISILSLEQSAEEVTHNKSMLERSIKDTNLRRELGMATDADLQALEVSLSNASVQLQSINTAMKTYKMQLQKLLGDTPTGNITLGGLPELPVTAFAEMDYETDLAAAKEVSWSIRSAEKELEDAKDDFDDAKNKYTSLSYKYEVAEHTWNAAQLTYQSAVQDFETAFHANYASLLDYKKTMESTTAATNYQASQYKIAQLQYDVGIISQSALSNAEAQLAIVQAQQAIAAYDLFHAYNAYCWAKDFGIVSQITV